MLITASKVVERALTNNVDTNLILQDVITLTQEDHIRPILGIDFYDELVSEVEADNLTIDNQAVFDLLEPALAFFVAYESTEDLNINSTSKGLITNDSEFGKPATREVAADWANKKLSQAKRLRDIMIRFIENEIEDDPAKYPLYQDRIVLDSKVIKGILFSQDDDITLRDINNLTV